MARKKTVHRYPDDWVVETKAQVNGRWLHPGTEVSIKGERGRFRFVKKVTTSTATWMDFIGGPEKHQKSRSFGEHQIKRVHRIAKTRENKDV